MTKSTYMELETVRTHLFPCSLVYTSYETEVFPIVLQELHDRAPRAHIQANIFAPKLGQAFQRHIFVVGSECSP